MIRLLVRLVLPVLLATACDPSEVSVTDDAGAAPDAAKVGDAADDARSHDDGASLPPTRAVITTATIAGGGGGTGALNAVDLTSRTVDVAIDTTLDPDTDVRCSEGKCYVVNRTHGTLRIYDSTTWSDPVEIPTGNDDVSSTTSNPHEAFPIPGTSKVYVALMGNPSAHAIGVIDSNQPEAGVLRWVAIPTTAKDGDGIPEVNNLHYCDGLVYVTVEDLDEANWFAPTGPSRIFVLDPATDALDLQYVIELQGENPVNWGVEGPTCDVMLVANAANQFGPVEGKGGIERVDLSSRISLGMVVPDTKLGGHPAGVVVASPTRAFALLNYVDASYNYLSRVVAFDPTSGEPVGDVTPPASFISFIELAPGPQLYVGVTFGDPSQGQLAPGLYIGPADGTPLPTSLLDLGQAPYSMSLDR